MPLPPLEPNQEVRFAVVMYGGVSLAIQINGVCQGLFRLARATQRGAWPTLGSPRGGTTTSSISSMAQNTTPAEPMPSVCWDCSK
jgi:hypothetical protein